MHKRSLSILLASGLLLSAANAAAAGDKAKLSKQAKLTERVRKGVLKLGLGPDAQMAVKLKNKTTLAGHISRADEDGFVLTNPKTGESTAVAYSDVSQAKGHNLSTGAKIGIGIAIGAGIVLVILLIYLNCCTG